MNSNPEELPQLPKSKKKMLGGRYKVLSQLGEGNFGQTFVAEDMHLPGHPRCVIKQLNPHFETEEELQTARRLFDTEAKVLARLGEHDQIPRLMAHFEEDHKFYLAQELIDGTPLDQLLDHDKRWNQAEVVALLKDLLQVLIFVHQQGVIHRDIKPSNLIRRYQDGKVVLIDFGAVKQVSTQGSDRSAKPDLTISIGTYGYTPSEQLAGNPQFNSDIYAAGLVAVRALTNLHPKFLGRDPLTNELQWQVEGVKVSPELAAVLDQMIRFDFRQRYASADEALAALWWSTPTELLGSQPDLKIGEEVVRQPQASRNTLLQARSSSKKSSQANSSTELPTLGQIFLRLVLPNFLKRWLPLGSVAVIGVALLATSLLSSRSGGLRPNQYSNAGTENSSLSASPNPAQPDDNSTSSPILTQDNSVAISRPDGFASIEAVPSGLFTYGGSTTWAAIREDVDPILQAANPGFQLRYADAIHGAPGSGTGIRMLLEGQLAFAQSSQPLKEEEHEEARLRGFSLKQVPVAIDAVVIAVHPKLAVRGLTLQQIHDIYTGKITNWKQVGGPNLSITPYSRRPADSGTSEYFVGEVLNGGSFGKNVQYVYSTTDAIRKLSNDPSGIYYASAIEIVPQCNVKPMPIAHLHDATKFVPPHVEPLVPPEQCANQKNEVNADAFRTGEYSLTRQLFVIIKENGQIDQQAGEAYSNLLLTNEGQTLIAKAGFIRIR
jgi:phosphate transport system substrate-binding protein